MRTATATVLFAIAAFAGDRDAVPAASTRAAAPVMRPQEPEDNRFVSLPGRPAPPPRELKDFTPPPPPPLPQAQIAGAAPCRGARGGSNDAQADSS